MKLKRTSSAVLTFAMLCDCAEPRAVRGHIDIRASHPDVLAESVHMDLRVEDRRVVSTIPIEGTTAEIWLTEDNCTHVMARSRSVVFCPLPNDPNTFSGAMGLGFAVELRQAKNILRVTVDGQFADFAIAHDAVGDELRAHPGLLGAVVRVGGLPPSTDGVYVTHTTPEPQLNNDKGSTK